MTLPNILMLLITGMVAGFAGGMLGLGGGFIMTPVLYIVFTGMGIPTDLAVRLAFGTSLLAILPTAATGAWRHHREGLVLWKAAFIMGGCGMVTALLSATLATHISGAWLKTAFGGLVIASAILMIVNRTRETGQPPRENPWLWAAWALPIGAVTGLLGVGGGTLLMPVMVLGLRFRMHNAVATSLAAIIFTSIGGITGYIINGLGVPGRPSFSAGYVDLPSWFFLAISSVGMTQIGAIAAHKLPERRLVYIFVAVMFYLGLKMLGIFDLLGWPL